MSNLAVLQEGEKTMTVRELAQVAGCGEKTVRDKVKAMFPEKVRNGKKTCLSEKEAFRVMAGIRKKGFVQPRKNYEVGESSLTAKDVEMITTIVSRTVAETIKTLDSRMSVIENKYQERKSLLPVPKMSDRDNLNRIIRQYASRENLNPAAVWGELYQDAYYQLHVNLKQKAKNRGTSIIEYAESEGLMPQLLSLAMEKFG